MQPFGHNIRTMTGDDVRMFGLLPFTTRMTVVRLDSGGGVASRARSADAGPPTPWSLRERFLEAA